MNNRSHCEICGRPQDLMMVCFDNTICAPCEVGYMIPPPSMAATRRQTIDDIKRLRAALGESPATVLPEPVPPA